MSFEEYQAELSILLEQLEGEQSEPHEVLFRLHQTLQTMRMEGLPIPENLQAMEEDLDARFSAEGRGER